MIFARATRQSGASASGDQSTKVDMNTLLSAPSGSSSSGRNSSYGNMESSQPGNKGSGIAR